MGIVLNVLGFYYGLLPPSAGADSKDLDIKKSD